LVWGLIGLVRAYRVLLAPVFPAACRFAPSCSQFAIEAIERHGVGRGFILATGRIARCHPWNAGGYDPVPEREG
jgi:putative membrane protein insertion efficiency factor